jgi:hypothetical protein
MEDITEIARRLPDLGIKVMVFSNVEDAYVDEYGTEEFVEKVNSDDINDWQAWHIDNRLLGYRKRANAEKVMMVMGLVQGSPLQDPKAVRSMMYDFVFDEYDTQ